LVPSGKQFSITDTYPYDFHSIPPRAWAAWKVTLRNSLAQAAAISASLIVVSSVSDGSIDVELSVYTAKARNAVQQALTSFCFTLDSVRYCNLQTTNDVCGTNPCENSGICLPATSVVDVTCACTLGFSGKRCEVEDCRSLLCENGGTCARNAGGDEVCMCPPQYQGVACESPASASLGAGDGDTSGGDIATSSALLIGAVVGGVCFLLLLVGLVIVLHRKRKGAAQPSHSWSALSADTSPAFTNELLGRSGFQSGSRPSSVLASSPLVRTASQAKGIEYDCPVYGTTGRFADPAAVAAATAALSSTLAIGSGEDDGHGGWSLETEYQPVEDLHLRSTASSEYAVPWPAPPRRISRDDLVLGKKIGGGEFGDVLEATVLGGLWPTRGTESGQAAAAAMADTRVAAKVVREGASPADEADLLAEEALMAAIPAHRNVVALLGSLVADRPLILVLELMDWGNLRSLLRSGRPTGTLPLAFSPAQILGFLEDAAAGMAFMGEHQLVHRDLAARNILIDGSYTAKIADFGLSRSVQAEGRYEVHTRKRKLAIKWLAPECIVHKVFSSQSDVFAFGITVWEAINLGRMPYPDLTAREAALAVLKGGRMPRQIFVSAGLGELMEVCWATETGDRPPFAKLQSRLAALRKRATQHLQLPKVGEPVCAHKCACVPTCTWCQAPPFVPVCPSVPLSAYVPHSVNLPVVHVLRFLSWNCHVAAPIRRISTQYRLMNVVADPSSTLLVS